MKNGRTKGGKVERNQSHVRRAGSKEKKKPSDAGTSRRRKKLQEAEQSRLHHLGSSLARVRRLDF